MEEFVNMTNSNLLPTRAAKQQVAIVTKEAILHKDNSI